MNLIHEHAKKEFLRIAKENGLEFTKEEVRAQAKITPAIVAFCFSAQHKPKPLMPRRLRRELLQLIAEERPFEDLPGCARVAFQAQVPERTWR